MKPSQTKKWGHIVEKIKQGKTGLLAINVAGRITWAGQEIPNTVMDLCPLDIVAQVRAIADQRAKEEEARSQAYAAHLRAEGEIVNSFKSLHREEPRWGLTGFYVEETTGPRWTLSQIEAWLDWSHGYMKLRYGSRHEIGLSYYPDDSGEAAYHEDLTPEFEDACEDPKRRRRFADFVRDCERYHRQPHTATLDQQLETILNREE